MRKIIIESKEKTVGNTIKMDILAKIGGEYQHGYISLGLLATQREKIEAMNNYVSKLSFKNLSYEEEQKNISFFKGGRR